MWISSVFHPADTQLDVYLTTIVHSGMHPRAHWSLIADNGLRFQYFYNSLFLYTNLGKEQSTMYNDY